MFWVLGLVLWTIIRKYIFSGPTPKSSKLLVLLSLSYKRGTKWFRGCPRWSFGHVRRGLASTPLAVGGSGLHYILASWLADLVLLAETSRWNQCPELQCTVGTVFQQTHNSCESASLLLRAQNKIDLKCTSTNNKLFWSRTSTETLRSLISPLALCSTKKLI